MSGCHYPLKVTEDDANVELQSMHIDLHNMRKRIVDLEESYGALFKDYNQLEDAIVELREHGTEDHDERINLNDYKDIKMKSASKIKPVSKEAEQAVIGALLLHHQSFDEVIKILSPDDFAFPENKMIFNGMCELKKNNYPLDLLIVFDFLKNNHSVGQDIELLLYEIVNNTPTATNVIAYASIVRERAVLRELMKTSALSDETVQDEPSDEELIEEGLKHLSEACTFFYEINSDVGIAMAFMTDAVLRYANSVYQGNDPRLSEEFLYEKMHGEETCLSKQ